MTHPHEARPHVRVRPRPRPVTVPQAFFGTNAPFITSPCRLCGWSLYAVQDFVPAIEASVQGVAAAAATLTMTGFFLVSSVVVTPAAAWPAGANVVTVSNVTGGPIITEIEGGTENPVVITFNPPAGVAGTPTASVPAMVGGPAYTIVGTGYSTPTVPGTGGAAAEIMDGGQVVAVVLAATGTDNSKWLSDEGVYVGTSLALNVLTGGMTGVVYILDDWHGGDN